MLQTTFKTSWFGNIKNDILAGLTVALALIPEAIAFSLICGVDPMVGLHASFCIAVVIAFAGGRPGMISAATGAMALVMVTLVKDHGIEFMYAATLLTGVLQWVLGRLRIGELINFVPHSVVLGFVNALAILIFMAQLPHFAGAGWVMYAMVLLTLAIIYLLPLLTKAVPSALVALIVMGIVSTLLGLDVKTVGDMGHITANLPLFHWPQVPLNLTTLKIIAPYAFTLAMVGIIESLLTATILDDLTDTKSDKSQEVKGQGIANIVASLFGGMAGCAMIGQSVINIKSGGRQRLSTLVAGVALLVLITTASPLVKGIPIPALVGLMFMVSISTFEWHSLRELPKMPRNCALGMLTTMAVIIVTHNLALGVLVGIIISSLVFAWKKNQISASVSHEATADGKKTLYRLHGQLFFASAQAFVDVFDYADDANEIVVDFSDSNVWDYSAVTALQRVKEKFNRAEKSFRLIQVPNASRVVIHNIDDSLLEGIDLTPVRNHLC